MSSKRYKTCKTCGLTKRLSEFNGHHQTADRKQPHCKSCMSEKILRAKNARVPELPVLSAEGQIEQALKDQIHELENGIERLRAGKIDIQIRHGKVTVTI